MRVIYWAGDSTNTENKAHKFPQTGIAQAFDRFTADDVVIYNHSINGRSTKSFIDQGRLSRIAREISKDDFLFIQFGHNDEKKEDPLRYTDPDGEFIENLKRFADTAKEKGAYPVYITPVERRLFNEDGKTLVTPSAHEPYAASVKRAAEMFDVPLVDLFTLSRQLLIREGSEASKRFYMHLKKGEAFWCRDGQIDDTHLKYAGAMAFSGLIAGELLKMEERYASLIDASVIAALQGDLGYEDDESGQGG
ncbi:MAG: rhamnogalacturonan acetylesterase [Lachnospiraceae bacterium]|nr:rhamnogalacturonan acetylesterase [Lachnospiraceae bacterium]